MLRVETRRGDLVLGMSLAEIVLLLLFAFFIVEVAIRENLGGQDPRIAIAALQEENARLRQQLSELEKKADDLAKRLKESERLVQELAKIIGCKPEDPASCKRMVETLKRGHPACADNNTLVEVISRDGSLDLTLLTEDKDLSEYLTRSGLSVRHGQQIAPNDVDAFLRQLWDFQNRPDKTCRFDYRLKYLSDGDYKRARQRFERYMYPEKQVEIGR